MVAVHGPIPVFFPIPGHAPLTVTPQRGVGVHHDKVNWRFQTASDIGTVLVDVWEAFETLDDGETVEAARTIGA